MAFTSEKPNVVRFGLFELDLQAGELRKGGVRIKLQDQPFQILAMLLERPGELVTREDLQKRLWPSDTFVDFDLSLNSAVKKLRQALSDASENPRYIETLYRRGYRFIGQVNGSNSKPVAESAPSPVGPHLLPPATLAEAPRLRTSLSSNHLLFMFLAIGLALGGVIFYFTRSQPIRVLGYTQITHDGREKGPIATDGERIYVNEVE